MVSAVHLLDDFLDSVDTLPGELRPVFQELRTLEEQFAELHRQLQKRRLLYLKADEKGLDAAAKVQLLKRIDRDVSDGKQLLQAKLDVERQCQVKLESLLKRYDGLLSTCSASVPLAPSWQSAKAELEGMLLANSTDPICYCQQPPSSASAGELVICANGANCRIRRFHKACVGGNPASGSWLCRDCQRKRQ